MFETVLPDRNGKSILVTGGTGRFGKAFIKRVLKDWKPKWPIIFSRDELKQWEMQPHLPQEKYPALRYFFGDVRRRLPLCQRHRYPMARCGLAEENDLIPGACIALQRS